MVKMAEKLTFGNTLADWQERINVARLREERAARARKIMRKYGIPALLVWTKANVRYLTGLKSAGSGQGNKYCLFFADHDPVVYEQAGWFRQMPDQAPWIKNWRISHSWSGGIAGPDAVRYQAEIFASDIFQELKERGLTGEKLGLVGVDGSGKAALEKLGLHCAESRSLILEARQVKTRDEINCHKMVAGITDTAWYRVWEGLRPGMRENDLTKIVGLACYEAGSDELPSVTFRSGPETFERGFDASGRIIEQGDLVYGALCDAIRYMGYGSCQYRTFIVGRKPNDREKDWYKILLDRVNAIIEAIKPGSTTADAAKFFDPVSKWGYTDEAEVLSIEIGHGIGIGDGHDYPVINRQWSLKHPQVIEPGMVIAVESCEGERRVGGVRLENMVVVTESGPEIIDHFPREEICVAPRS
ncbi:MAG: aminopeptidase P family protein [Chloroflexi bacterium]|nr:aminopeptidase P family protein [Chloroflexota bacterium]